MDLLTLSPLIHVRHASTESDAKETLWLQEWSLQEVMLSVKSKFRQETAGSKCCLQEPNTGQMLSKSPAAVETLNAIWQEQKRAVDLTNLHRWREKGETGYSATKALLWVGEGLHSSTKHSMHLHVCPVES